MADSITALPQSQQKPKLNHLYPPFVGKAPIIQLQDRDYPYREQGMPMAMIQAGVVTELCVIRTVQGSMAVDQEADRLKVSRDSHSEYQPEKQQQSCVPFFCRIRVSPRFEQAC